MRNHSKIISFALIIMVAMTMFVPAFASEEISVYLDDKKIEFDVSPLLVDGRTMVPMRAIFEKLGAVVFWDSDTRTAIANKGNVNVSISIGDTTLHKNGQLVALDVPAQLSDGRTLVPLRAVSEAFDCEVIWNGNTRTVNILSKKELSVKDMAINELIGWIEENYNNSLDGNRKNLGYKVTYGNDDFQVSYSTDTRKVQVSYITRTSTEITGVFLELTQLQYMGSYADENGIVISNGYVVDSKQSDSLELIETAYESDGTENKSAITAKFYDYAENTLMLFDKFLEVIDLGLTLEDFGLDYDLPKINTSNIDTNNSYNTSDDIYQESNNYYYNTKITVASFPLYLYADDGTGTFLGEINSNKYDTDSIANEYGNYGSKYQTKSIFNQYGTYGSKYSQYSVFNEYATHPPKILDKNGKTVGYLTANKYITDAVSYEEMMVLLKKFNK